MKRKFLFPIICISLLISGYSMGQEVKKLTGPDVVPPVYGIVEVPETNGLHPSVLILHGGDGWNPYYTFLAKKMSNSGYVALTIDLYAEIGPPTSRQDYQRRFCLWPQWQETARNAISYLRSHPSSKDQPVGILGVSMGAHLAISVANQIPEIDAVVDFYGAGGYGGSLESQAVNFPPLLILHGEADSIVPVSNAYELQKAVLSNGGEVEMNIYPNAKHAFNRLGSPDFIGTATQDAANKTGLFLDKWLKGDK